MTDKQALFVAMYLGKAKLNATKAARLAGYADPEKEGWRVRQDPEVEAEIRGRISEYAMGPDEILSRLAEQARASLDDFVEADHWGSKKPQIAFTAATLKQKGHLIKSFEVGKMGTKLVLQDQQKALELLARAQGMFVERHEVTGTEGGDIVVKVLRGVSMDDL